jgi:hypothetical protein
MTGPERPYASGTVLDHTARSQEGAQEREAAAEPGLPGGAAAGQGSEIGVPRFELGTSPTRTERATRLRHTPTTDTG